MSFQPLGDNCEFGLVQRPFGAEPIDLLRWNAIGPEALICGLDCNFEDIENPESTELDLDGEEFVLKDHRYGMAMHTFIRLHQCEAR